VIGARTAADAGATSEAAALVRRFQRVAWAALGVLLATGIYNVVVLVPLFQASDSMPRFMWTLTAKIALFGAAVAVTGVQQWSHVRTLGATGDPKALAGWLRLGRANLLLGALIFLLGVSLSLAGGIG
jgi:putative copper export protein